MLDHVWERRDALTYFANIEAITVDVAKADLYLEAIARICNEAASAQRLSFKSLKMLATSPKTEFDILMHKTNFIG